MLARAAVAIAAFAALVASADAQPLYPGGGSAGPVYCNASLQGSGPAATYEVVAAKGGTAIYVCGQNVTANASGTWQMKSGTGTLCANNTVLITPAFNLSGSTPLATRSPVAGHFLLRDHALCVTITGTLQWVIFYSQF